MEEIRSGGQDELLNVVPYKAGDQRPRESLSQDDSKVWADVRDWEIVGPLTRIREDARESDFTVHVMNLAPVILLKQSSSENQEGNFHLLWKIR